MNALKLHGATLPLAEFAAVVGNLRGARFGRAAAWRTASTFGALDELRHAQIPLTVLHELVQVDRQFDWIARFYHSNDWVAIAARHLADELLLGRHIEPCFVPRAKRHLFAELECGRATVAGLARRLAMGERSLQRRLASEGSSFAELLDDLRR